MRLSFTIVCATALVLLACAGSLAKIQEGSIKTDRNWIFMSKFCFSNQYGGLGNVTFKLRDVDAKHKNLSILVYYDQPNTDASGSWFRVWHNSTMSCSDKTYFAKASATIFPPLGGGEFTVGDWMSPHYWYMVVADCASEEGLDFDYYVEWNNPGGGWNTQLSFDDQGIPQFFLTYFFFYLILVGLHAFAVLMLRKMECYHPVIQLLSIAIGISFLANIFFVIHWCVLANNGMGAPGVKGLADLLTFGMDIILSLLVILIAKGWAVTTTQLEKRDRMGIIVMVCVLALGYIILFIWDYAGQEPAATLYFWESAPGYIVIILRMATMVWFIYSLWSTLRLETLPEKRRFYFVFGAIYTVWFLIIPIAVIIAAIVPAPWRQKVVTDFRGVMDWFSLAIMAVLFWPSYARRFFIITPGQGLISKDAARQSEPTL